MKNRLPEILAFLAMASPIFLAPEALAGEIKLTRPSPNIFEVSGGIGEKAWHIQYGTGVGLDQRAPYTELLALAGPGSAAYFSHGNWLRRLDVDKGVVTGRWHFGGAYIAGIRLKGDHLEVDVADFETPSTHYRVVHRIIDFNPADPHISYWPSSSLLPATLPESETHCCARFNATADQAQQWLNEAQNSVMRDPLSPWLRIELAHIFRELGKTEETSQLIKAAVTDGPADYTELLRLSSALKADGRKDEAERAFERGYQSFWQAGNDPRLVSALLSRLSLHFNSDVTQSYLLGPWTEAAEYAWSAESEFLERSGKHQEAATWRERADEARRNSLFPMNSTLASMFRPFMLLLPAAGTAALLYFLSLLRYVPQRRMQARADRQQGVRRRFGFFNIEYWSRKERFCFLTIAAIGWLGTGLFGAFLETILRYSTMPLSASMGTFAGPGTIYYFENEIPKSPERDLLVAMAYQHDGQPEKAEELYRQLPQFAESWNNLGVLLKSAGKNDEARAAFERAQQIAPQQEEAHVNLDNPPMDFWSKSHQQYLPGKALLAPPTREHFIKAVGIGQWDRLAIDALEGPLRGIPAILGPSPFGLNLRPPGPFVVVFLLTFGFFALTVLAALFVPVRDVTQPPPRLQPIVDYLVPGTAPEWRAWGGFVLLGLIFLVAECFASKNNGGPMMFGNPNLERSFGVPGASVAQTSITYFYAGILALYLANAALVAFSRRTRV